jgi:hypothetical protein
MLISHDLLVPGQSKMAPPAPARPLPNCQRNAGGFEHGLCLFENKYSPCCTAEGVAREYMAQEVFMAYAVYDEYKYYLTTSPLH